MDLELDPINILNAQFSGPWNMNNRNSKLLNEVSQSEHLDVGLKTAALNNLDEKGFPVFTSANYWSKCRGIYTSEENMVSVNSIQTSDQVRATIAHEFYHSILDNIYINSSNPYSNPQQEKIFAQAVHDTLINLHKEFLPNIELPSEIDDLIINLNTININKLLPQDKKIMESILQVLNKEYYPRDELHAEMAVKIPEFIGRFDNLPPHIIDL